GADLHLDRHAVRPEQRRMQRLVTVDAGDGDVILEAPRHGAIEAVDDSQDAITRVDRIDDDAKAEYIDDRRQRHAFAPHLLINAVQVFLAPFHAPVDARFLERLA